MDVCPVDCFREGPNFLVIEPDECIDCTLCVAECPVEAIYAEDDVPENQRHYIQLNAELSQIWKPIIERKDAPADADEDMGSDTITDDQNVNNTPRHDPHPACFVAWHA